MEGRCHGFLSAEIWHLQDFCDVGRSALFGTREIQERDDLRRGNIRGRLARRNSGRGTGGGERGEA